MLLADGDDDDVDGTAVAVADKQVVRWWSSSVHGGGRQVKC